MVKQLYSNKKWKKDIPEGDHLDLATLRRQLRAERQGKRPSRERVRRKDPRQRGSREIGTRSVRLWNQWVQCHRISVVRRKYAPGWSWTRHMSQPWPCWSWEKFAFCLECSEVSLQGVSQGIKFIFCVSVHLVFQVGHSMEVERTLRKILQGSGWDREVAWTKVMVVDKGIWLRAFGRQNWWDFLGLGWDALGVRGHSLGWLWASGLRIWRMIMSLIKM